MTCPALVVLGAVLASTPAVVEKDGVRIAVSVMSHIYTWEVTNLGTEPITAFEIEYHKCYQHHAPDGWVTEADGELFRAWTSREDRAIFPGRTGTFSARTSSGGNVLGVVPAWIGFGGGRERALAFEEVWGPVKKPRSLVVLVAVLVGAIALTHTGIVMRRNARTGVNDQGT